MNQPNTRFPLSVTRCIAATLAALAFAIVAVSAVIADDARTDRLAPSPRLAVPPLVPATTQAKPAPTPGLLRRPFLPTLGVTIAPRPLPAASQPARINAPEPMPAIALANRPMPSIAQFAQPARLVVMPPVPLAPRIPNLLVSSRRAQWSTANPIIVPAAAVETPTINNLDGTQARAPLSPFARGMLVEIAQPPTPLTIDQEPYLRSPAAPDDQDVPARAQEHPARPAVK